MRLQITAEPNLTAVVRAGRGTVPEPGAVTGPGAGDRTGTGRGSISVAPLGRLPSAPAAGVIHDPVVIVAPNGGRFMTS